MKKVIALSFLFCLFSGYCFPQTVNNANTTIEITNVVVNGGRVYLAIFSTAEEFKQEKPYLAYEFADNNASVSQAVSLPSGEYVVSAFQDANGNKEMDYNFLGIPKELVGISNYYGKGFPAKSFDKQKILINNSTGKVTIGLYKF
jgi:uncharacterized protein (DUF2141 family)